MSKQSNAFYSDAAAKFYEQYQSLTPSAIYRQVLPAFDLEPGMVLDIGSASGRDSNWLAERGHKVVSVEPAIGLRDFAIATAKHRNVTYFDSSLPELKGLDQFVGGFDLILCAAVLMHLDPLERRESLKNIVGLLANTGKARAVVTFKVAPAEPERAMNSLAIDDVLHDLNELGLPWEVHLNQDLLGRDDTRWYSATIWKKTSE